ncbi:hypothetical protein PTE30175_04886 [Pandoraea terrae]|uniref:PD-(D/E)XK nuclease superfamily protein n=1 Tax=Pandoraea terrae TaxID=1537710 RepID=A0A5E4Z259_9BURK|nr:PD-(D/E)XK nuclease family protein [Pandoraea terrae]VVE55219.1 hypothetical protein PTE30175_04886 [Pandoraea terrae]
MATTASVTQEQFERFLSDPVLTRSTEVSRRIDDIFDLINPNENQHSSILQWLFDPREGHGQGEAIFKDFLVAVHEANRESAKPQGLFQHWSPGRIAVTGFQSLIVIREKSMVGRGRQDLLLVDPIHRFVILVENKAGASWRGIQLENYRNDALALKKRGGPYYGYQVGFVLLDRYKDESTIFDDKEIRHWSYLDYMWLEKAARRAEARVERGVEPGQQLVISYCRRQAEYESKEEAELEALLAQLARNHREVVGAIGRARRRKYLPAKDLDLDDFGSQLWAWTHQYKELAEKLEKQKSLSFIGHELSKAAPGEQPKFDLRKRAIFVTDASWLKLMTDTPDARGDCFWPVCIRVLEMKSSEDYRDEEGPETPRKYSINVNFRPPFLKEGLEPEVREALAALYDKELGARIDAKLRRIGHTPHSEENLPKALLKRYEEVHNVLKPIIAKIEG